MAEWSDYRKTSSFRRGARWNSPGQPVMYLSSNVQNAMLEIANYAISPKMANSLYRLVVFEFPLIRLHTVRVPSLPAEWSRSEHHAETQVLGDTLLRKAAHDGFVVPTTAVHSAISMHPNRAIRETSYQNVVINLEKIDPTQVKILERLSPVFSTRMFSGVSAAG